MIIILPSFLIIGIGDIHFIIANILKMSRQCAIPSRMGEFLLWHVCLLFASTPTLQKGVGAPGDRWPCCVGRLSVKFLGRLEAAADAIDEARLLL